MIDGIKYRIERPLWHWTPELELEGLRQADDRKADWPKVKKKFLMREQASGKL